MERYQQQYRALGSDAVLTLVTEGGAAYAERLFDRLRQHIEAFEQQFSRFLPESELTQFNQKAGAKTTVSNSFRKLLSTTKNLAVETDGLYNPFILPALQQAGYLGSWPQPEAGRAATDFSERTVVPPEELRIGDSWARMPEGSALDFGGIGKGYLLDELADLLDGENLGGYWLSLGGDINCAGHDIEDQIWRVAVQSALEPDKSIDTITNPDGRKLAIATSGVTKRQGVKAGKHWHHLIDPRTGEPADTTILTATVTAEQAVIADVYAKCIVIAGVEQAEQYQADHRIQSFLIQTTPPADIIEPAPRAKTKP